MRVGPRATGAGRGANAGAGKGMKAGAGKGTKAGAGKGMKAGAGKGANAAAVTGWGAGPARKPGLGAPICAAGNGACSGLDGAISGVCAGEKLVLGKGQCFGAAAKEEWRAGSAEGISSERKRKGCCRVGVPLVQALVLEAAEQVQVAEEQVPVQAPEGEAGGCRQLRCSGSVCLQQRAQKLSAMRISIHR